MPDARFFLTLDAIKVSDLAERIGGTLVRGGDAVVTGVAPLATADDQTVAFLGDRKFVEAMASTSAGCVILPESAVELAPSSAAVITSREPQAAWSRAALALHRPILLDHAASVSEVCEDESVSLAPGVVLGKGARIGRGTHVGANTVIGPGVQIGRNCQIGSQVTLGFALIGDRVTILSGARIGEAGFGAAGSSTGPVDVPQLGRVILQDGVTIGANTCIDRGAFDDTVVGENSKIDNLVQIGHNCVIGRNALIAAHTGISGSVRVGDNVMFGGKAGIGDHISIGEGARVAAGAGVLADIPAGETWSGYPAKPIRQFLRETVWLARQVTRKKGEGRD
ncbi:UDP-3-O-(3-hydroxymyristoyl)glucosamine N-acyltransferase [Brevundimonas variabilis]|uniref:UDP-3-O-acylglucosamine N-acyltransferase n=1 Tax=Brevundimonas variabilis TaxID=74312 RepID=A0A7W9CHI8_9CAUL|nr:UDP-3-O-(3-hydroxymyristoyl)glucosamine N-acyltransferase [Brevundimonas variabilis]MBB5745763.1 UDP-3-O-[3-hydroxymyristoyl] glucosamine N-acyltransferase [Brevundimonas variabilis]